MLSSPFFKTYADPDADLQRPADVAVVMPTLLRPSIREALQSVFRQSGGWRIHLLIGIDRPEGSLDPVDQACEERPSNMVVQLYYPGYSTSDRFGGLGRARDGGVTRLVLTYLANARHVAYLDDDNWWHADHLRWMLKALAKGQWAYALRWFVHPLSKRPVCVDDWESVGPRGGIFPMGWVDPNCLMFDKLACESAIPFWNIPVPGDRTQMTADRMVFRHLKENFVGVGTGRPSVYYLMGLADGLHPARLQRMGGLYDSAGDCLPPGEQIVPAMFGPYPLIQRQI